MLYISACATPCSTDIDIKWLIHVVLAYNCSKATTLCTPTELTYTGRGQIIE